MFFIPVKRAEVSMKNGTGRSTEIPVMETEISVDRAHGFSMIKPERTLGSEKGVVMGTNSLLRRELFGNIRFPDPRHSWLVRSREQSATRLHATCRVHACAGESFWSFSVYVECVRPKCLR